MTLFADSEAATLELRSDRLIVAARTYFPGIYLSDNYIYTKLLAAEKEAEHRLRVFLEPVEIIPEGTDSVITDALDLAGVRWVEEPGYDYEPEMFRGEQWGYIITRQKPIISVTSLMFTYPSPAQQPFLMTLPMDWLRIDKKHGHVRIVPTGTPFNAPLGAYVLSVMGGGRTIPAMLRIRYVAGLKSAEIDYPDLVDTIKKLAILNILSDQFLPQSGSISADGLSRSMSIDVDKHKDGVDARLNALRDQIHGIRMIGLT
jgi:hypothetical protein